MKTATLESESPQFQSLSQCINYQNNSFPAVDVLFYIPAVCLQAFTLPRPLHFYCLYRQRVATGTQVVIYEVEYIPITSAVCSMHMLSVMPSQAFYYILNVFLLAPWLFIVFCAVLPCLRPCLKWQPSSPSEGHTKRLSIQSRRPLDMPVNKHGLLQSASFLCRHLLPFPARCHIWPSSTPKMYI